MQSDIELAMRLMSDFADRTGLATRAKPQRYLWTDAFGVLNLLELHRKTGESRWRDLAQALIADVHGVLGRHRDDDPRQGWLSGLANDEAIRHPTVGGLRIGKPRPERALNEPYDDRLEWERDGQYWHYLTKWMDALSRAAVLLGEPHYQRHAEELAQAAFVHFLRYSPNGHPQGLAWKMSVDLSRPQLPGTSPHDALDGYVTFRWLGRNGRDVGLAHATGVLKTLADQADWASSDPLGIGGLLLDAVRLARLPDRTEEDEDLISAVLSGANAGLSYVFGSGVLEAQATRRLAFRELGLAIGLQTLPAISEAASRSSGLANAIAPHCERLRARADAGRRIVDFWSSPQNQRSSTWTDHRDINDVMLAAALLGSYVETATLPG